ncbi:uncharacterized protein K489DRAFT_312676 [Dissoconium aciculare CBS 342.82]|uniref:SWI5-dependent HO expression protein 3 n=1 Tax=Dissoconium aciculare CBS 342.82 TaxID=1314786 RepID=A0A6J3ME21_9PEZI|nr:uncharacterized protein K489DRAFT_312676 [Dissoconium aciculare CBS 342.82]KAF1826118.1 hypothetical protein K489DRAFT_312676 [Dissoconium aciculare CBS 342.82]
MSSNHATTNIGLLTPLGNGMRRTSGEALGSQKMREQSPTPSLNGNATFAAMNASPSAENNQWSSAVGHATTGGKSGRVIEKLMTENDRLKRELNEQVIKAEELQRSMQMYKPKIDALQAENDNLSHARGVDSALISRRDRKIDELKADLTQERQRRAAIEQRSRNLERERDEAVEEKNRNIQTLTESTKHAIVHAQILETSHKQLSAEYRARFEASKKDLTALREEREDHRSRLARLDVVNDQMRQELERTKKSHNEMVAVWEEYQETSQETLQSMDRRSAIETDRVRKLNEEMTEVVHEMRWVMGLKKNLRVDSKSGPAP